MTEFKEGERGTVVQLPDGSWGVWEIDIVSALSSGFVTSPIVLHVEGVFTFRKCGGDVFRKYGAVFWHETLRCAVPANRGGRMIGMACEFASAASNRVKVLLNAKPEASGRQPQRSQRTQR